MISKRIEAREDGRSSALSALQYGEGLKPARETGEFLEKSHRTRLGNFGLVDDGVYAGRDLSEMSDLIELAALEMQSNCDLNTRVSQSSQLAHFVCSFNQDEPTEAVLRDTEDSILSALNLSDNHFASFLHNDNGFWHLHIFSSRIEKGPSHRCNDLWHDQIKRDRVCREIEKRHGLKVDNGFHQFNEQGQIVEVPREERRARREKKPNTITEKARVKEHNSGEKSFQTWCDEIRIGDRLKHAKSWKELHEAAAAYNCEVKQKGAGFVICPTGEKGGVQLSKVGLKNLPAKFGVFVPPIEKVKSAPEMQYKPEPTKPQGVNLYEQWRQAREAFKPQKTDSLNEQRETQKHARADMRKQHKITLEKIRASVKWRDKHSAVSIAKMEQAAALAALSAQHAEERGALRARLAEVGPGNTFRDYLLKQANLGDAAALGLVQSYRQDESTPVLQKREAKQLKIVATVAGQEWRPSPLPPIKHHVERSGTIVFNLGRGRSVTDSAAARQIQLNVAAATDQQSVEVALRFAVSKFGPRLTLTGSAEFQRLAVETAVLKGLGVRFADPALEAYRESFAASQRQKSIFNRGDVVLNSLGNVLPLRQDVSGGVVQQQQKKPDHGMQRPAAGDLGTGRPSVTSPLTSSSKHKPAPQALSAKPLPACQLPTGVALANQNYQGRGSVSLIPGFVLQSRGRYAPVAIPLSAFSDDQLDLVRSVCVPCIGAGARVEVSLALGRLKSVAVVAAKSIGKSL